MSTALYNLVRMTTPTTGTGPVTLGSTVPGFNSFSAASIPNGALVSYALSDGGNSEVGRGVYNSANGTVSRQTIYASTNGGAAINLDGNGQISLSPIAQDFAVQADYATVAAAAADSINPNTAFIRTAGYASAGDYGAALYGRTNSLVAGGFQSADGAFWKIVNDVVTPQMYGAVGNGTTDDTAAFQNAINSYKLVSAPYVGTLGGLTGYLIAGTLSIGPGQAIKAQKQVVLNCSSLACFAIQPDVSGIPETVVEGFQIDMTAAVIGSAAIQFRSSLGTILRVRLRNMRYTNCFAAYQQDAASANPVVDLLSSDCLCYFTRGSQIVLNNTAGFIIFWRFQIDNTYNTVDIAWQSATFTNFAGLELHLFDVLGVATRTNYQNYPAIGIQGGSFLVLDRVLIDTTENNGLFVSGVDNINIVLVNTQNNLGYGQYYQNCSRIKAAIMMNSGNKGASRDNASQNVAGIVFDGCTSGQVGVISSDYSGSGSNGGGAGVLLKNGTAQFNFAVVRATNNAGGGWVETDTCNFNVKASGSINTNVESSLIQVGASSAFLNLIPQSGAFIASTVGAETVA